MEEEKKTRVRRSSETVRQEKIEKCRDKIKQHENIIEALKREIEALQKPVKTDSQIRKELMKMLAEKNLEELANFAGKDLEEIRKS